MTVQKLFPATLITCIILAVSACVTSPTGRKQVLLIPDTQMEIMGIEAFNDIKQNQPLAANPDMNRLVQCVARAIIESTGQPFSDWEVVLFDSPQLNAFALPGRKIGVYQGLLKAARNQHQLAAVIGHELGHVLAHHGNERLSTHNIASMGLQVADLVLAKRDDPRRQQAMAILGLGVQYGVILPYSRQQETEADLMGLEIMARAGFDPAESIQLWQNMAAESGTRPPEFLSTHPSSDTRIDQLTRALPEAQLLYQHSPHRPQCQRP